MTTLVTGATGLLGNNVVRMLRSAGRSVRVLVRESADPRPLESLDVDVVRGDIREPDAVQRACDGVDSVVHSAAHVHIGWSQRELAQEINVEGTRHVAEAAVDAGARMVHVSTVDTLAAGSPDQPATEDFVGEKVPCTYVVTKRLAEQALQPSIERGLDVVIVHPGFMLGPWDWKPSSGQMLVEVVKRSPLLAPTGGASMCDVRDVAAGILAVLDKRPPSDHYILAGHNLTYRDAWKLFVAVTGQGRAPRMRAGPLMRVVGGAWGDFWGKLTRQEPLINSAAIRMSSLFHYYSSALAERELGYTMRPLEESVQDAWNWFEEHGYV